MKIEVISFCQVKNHWSIAAGEELVKKISRYGKIQKLNLKTTKSVEKKKIFERDQIFSQLSNRDFLIICDENGHQFSSKQFSGKLEQWIIHSSSKLVFAIGGAFGWHEDVKQRANQSLSLSELTMNHLLAEVVLLEQIYRAFSILHNHPYHND